MNKINKNVDTLCHRKVFAVISASDLSILLRTSRNCSKLSRVKMDIILFPTLDLSILLRTSRNSSKLCRLRMVSLLLQ